MDVHIRRAEDGEQLGLARLLAAFDDLMVSEYALDPGTEPGEPHYHSNHTDTFYVLDGELEFVIDGRPVRATAGTLVVAPRGAEHAFPVAVSGPARFLNVHAPGGFDRYLRALHEVRERGERPSVELQHAHDQYPV